MQIAVPSFWVYERKVGHADSAKPAVISDVSGVCCGKCVSKCGTRVLLVSPDRGEEVDVCSVVAGHPTRGQVGGGRLPEGARIRGSGQRRPSAIAWNLCLLEIISRTETTSKVFRVSHIGLCHSKSDSRPTTLQRPKQDVRTQSSTQERRSPRVHQSWL